MTAPAPEGGRHKTGPKPKPPKKRVIVRIHKALRTVLEDMAEEAGTKPATLLQQLVRRRMAAHTGPYTASDDAAVYILTRTEGQIAAKQMTLYLTDAEYTRLTQMAGEAGVTLNQLVTCLLTDELSEQGIL